MYARPFMPIVAMAALSIACQHHEKPQGSDTDSTVRKIVILATNDIHGALEPGQMGGKPVGGMAMWASVVRAVRRSIEKKPHHGLLVVDAGDQFQGTLLSNFDEGQATYRMMSSIGYDAVIPGNHAFDFGPVGWLGDKVTGAGQDPRGAWHRLVQQAKFPILTANTYLKSSLRDSRGNPVAVKGVGCEPEGALLIDWSTAERPDFATPSLVREVAGVRVAIIGIDHRLTPVMTTPENVSDLCFRDELATYLDARTSLSADIFILLLHSGDSQNESVASTLVEKLVRHSSGRLVDAVIAGHTHQVNRNSIDGVPLIQSGANGEQFGRIELNWDPETRKILGDKTKSFAGLYLNHSECDKKNTFCEVRDGQLYYDGEKLEPSEDIASIVRDARRSVAGVADRVLGTSDGKLSRDRIHESTLANTLTDEVRNLTGTDVSLLNTGGIRADIAPGSVRYEDLFRTLPFSNHGVTLGPMALDTLLEILRRSVKTCGSYGAIMQSGLKVKYSRRCDKSKGATDPLAELTRVELIDGTLLFDKAKPQVRPARTSFTVATFDFLASGGDGYPGFKTVPLIRDFGVLREVLTDRFLITPFHWTAKLDGRWHLETTSETGR